MTDIRQLQLTWEHLAREDPFWAICTDATKKGGKWDREEFFATGESEIETVLQHVPSLGLKLDYRGPALDFGCGVGRLSRALARHFGQCYGVDISATMVRLATEHHRADSRCRFFFNEAEDLSLFPTGTFSFVYSSIVLQHMEPHYGLTYISEFIRVLKPGGIAVFQVPDRARSLREKLGIGARVKRLFSVANMRLGPSMEFTGGGPMPLPPVAGRMEMHSIFESDVRRAVRVAGAKVCDVRVTNSIDEDFNGRLRYVGSSPQGGLVSKQYCVIKYR